MQSQFIKSLLFLFLIISTSNVFSMTADPCSKRKSWNVLGGVFNNCQNKGKGELIIHTKDGKKFDGTEIKQASEFWRGMADKKGNEIQIEFSSSLINVLVQWANKQPMWASLSPDLLPEFLEYIDMSQDLEALVSFVSTMKDWPAALSEMALFESNYRKIEKFLVKNLEQAFSICADKLQINQPKQMLAFLVTQEKIFFEEASLVAQKYCEEINQDTRNKFFWEAYSRNSEVDKRPFFETSDWCEHDWQEARRAMRDILSSYAHFQNLSCKEVSGLKDNVKAAIKQLKPANADEAHNAIRKLFFLSLLVVMAENDFQNDLIESSYAELPRIGNKIFHNNVTDLIARIDDKNDNLFLKCIKNLANALSKDIQ